MSWLRRLFDGIGWYVAAGAALATIGALVVLLIAQSPRDSLLWTGTKVQGYEHHGLVYYQWQGEQYTIDVPGFGNKSDVSVYLDPSNPSEGETNNNLNRIFDILLTVVPVGAGLMIVGAGVRRRHLSERNAMTRGGHGTGLDPEFVANQLKQIRRPPT